MITYSVIQGTSLNALWGLEWERNPKCRGYIYIRMADIFYCTVETKTIF